LHEEVRLAGLLIYTIVAGGVCNTVGPFAGRVVMGGGHDARRFTLLLLAIVGSMFASTIPPLTFFLIRFVRHQRRHPWTPPNAFDSVAGTVRRRPDRAPRAIPL
jgi:hypothetical protein